MLRVLKAVNLLSEKNEPTELYSKFMNLDEGGKVLGPELKRLYAPLFDASLTPYNDGSDKLQNLFNIHSGGGERSLEYQIQTFKALCENASFDASNPIAGATTSQDLSKASLSASMDDGGKSADAPVVHINLHIHLPENKTRRDYEDIIEDIGRYIFGRAGVARD